MSPHNAPQTGDELLTRFIGTVLVPRKPAQDRVNAAMIRHWAESMGDLNPVFLDDEAARATGRPGIVAPATMVQAWTMRGYAAHQKRLAGESSGSPQEDAFNRAVAEAGYPAVVATDSEFHFERELRIGDLVHVEERLESISAEKATGLGPGRFVDMVRTYTDEAGEVIATQRWRTLRFSPKTTARTEEETARRPRPALNRDNTFWFEAAHEHKLLIQSCSACKELRHPPSPSCPRCQSFDWETVESKGQGVVYSFTVAHHPKIPGFAYPYIVAVVELSEGTRLIANIVKCEPHELKIGAPVQLDWLRIDDDLTIPVFELAQEGTD